MADDDGIADYRHLGTNNLPHIPAVIQQTIDHSATGRMDIKKIQKKLRRSYLLPVIAPVMDKPTMFRMSTVS